jgi:hypothetical protein
MGGFQPEVISGEAYRHTSYRFVLDRMKIRLKLIANRRDDVRSCPGPTARRAFLSVVVSCSAATPLEHGSKIGVTAALR